MTDGTTTGNIPGDAPTAVELPTAMHGGDLDLVRRLIARNPDLARARFVARGGSGTALHIVTDWPGYFPNGPDMVHLLIDAGAAPNATTTGPGKPETPLHYAASSDDVDVAAALIDRGADLETPDGSIGTPLDNAIGYACWHAAALGALDILEILLVPGTDREEISKGFWHACGAGQRRTAERLLNAGADLDWVPGYAEGTALDAADGLGTRQENVISWLRSIGARSAHAEEEEPHSCSEVEVPEGDRVRATTTLPQSGPPMGRGTVASKH